VQPNEEKSLTWEIVAGSPGPQELHLQLTGAITATMPLTIRFLPAVGTRKLPTSRTPARPDADPRRRA